MQEWLNASWRQEIWAVTYTQLPMLGMALGVLIGGWLVAFIVQKLVFAALKRTTLDDRLAAILGVDLGAEGEHRVERMVSKGVYYVLLLFVVVAFFGALKIEAVTKPLLTLLDEITGAVPNLIKGVLLGFGGYLLAVGVRRLIVAVLGKLRLERRLMRLTGEEPPPKTDKEGKKRRGEQRPFAETLGDVAYWVILAVVAIPVLEALEIGALAAPLSATLATVTTYLPRIAGAAVLLVAGYLVARIVRAAVSGALSTIGVDRAMARLGFGAVLKEQTVSGVLGALAMAFVLLQFTIAAVGRLDIAEISLPLTLMLERVYAILPSVLVGLALMAVGVVIARVAANLTARLLAAMGLNTLVAHIGVFKGSTLDARRQEEESRRLVQERLRTIEGGGAAGAGSDAPEALLSQHGTTEIRTPADVAGVAVGAVVVLLFLRQTLATMGLEGLGLLLDRLLGYLPHVLAALLVLGAGLWAGGWARARVDELTLASSDRLLRGLGTAAYVAIVAFSGMVALDQLGVGRQLIALAFGLILGAVCLALALSFGLGGRELAGKVLQEEYDRRKRGGFDGRR